VQKLTCILLVLIRRSFSHTWG